MEKELKLNQIISDLMEGRTHPITAKADILLLFSVSGRSEQLCGFFEADTKTSSATKCKCGREKWEHPKAT